MPTQFLCTEINANYGLEVSIPNKSCDKHACDYIAFAYRETRDIHADQAALTSIKNHFALKMDDRSESALESTFIDATIEGSEAIANAIEKLVSGVFKIKPSNVESLKTYYQELTGKPLDVARMLSIASTSMRFQHALVITSDAIPDETPKETPKNPQKACCMLQ